MRVNITNAVGAHKLGPADLEAEEARRLIHEGYAVAVDQTAKPAKVAEILVDVDGDPAKAAQALAAEEAAAKPRSTLIDALTAIANPDREV